MASLETLGLAYKQATELIGLYYDAFHNETKLATNPNALAEEKAGVEALEKDLLIKKVAQPLSQLQYTCFAALVKNRRQQCMSTVSTILRMEDKHEGHACTCMRIVCSTGTQQKMAGIKCM